MTRRARIFLAVALLAAALLLSLRWLAQPSRLAGFALDRIGTALGLEISAKGASEYRLRGTPALVLREVTVREPGAQGAMLTARRIGVALPWSTLRGGRGLLLHRIELDAPVLDLAALQRWRDKRPPAEARLPTLTNGLRVRDGVLAGAGWRIDRIAIDLPRLDAGHRLRARMRGRYLDAPLAVPFDLALAATRPEALVRPVTSGFAVNGRITFETGKDWRMPAAIALSGPLTIDDAHGARLDPARLGLGATLETATGRTPLALGLHGPLRFGDATLALRPASLSLRAPRKGEAGTVPEADAHGAVLLGAQLRVRLEGSLSGWPGGWPALPPPIGQSQSPLAFALAYDGAPGFTDIAALRLQRDATRFDGRFRLPDVMAWSGLVHAGSPLPPLSGTLHTPRIEVAGATLEGVEAEFLGEATGP